MNSKNSFEKDNMTKITVVINIYNEADVIEKCLESVFWADEIVIIDMESTDESIEICTRYTKKIFTHPHDPIVEKARDFGINQASNEWILILDPDERVSPSLAHNLLELVSDNPTFVAVRIPRRTYIFGRKVNNLIWAKEFKIGLIRFFKREYVRWKPEVHAGPTISGDIFQIEYDENLNNAIIHFNYSTIADFVERLNRYTTAEAERLFTNDRPFRWYKLFYHPIKALLKNYVIYKGYREGIYGLILSLLMSFYRLITYMKLWEIEENQDKSKKRIV